jgi:hypothetical protein
MEKLTTEKEARTGNIHPSRRNTPKKKPMNQPNDHGVFCLLGVRRQPASVRKALWGK